MFNRTLWPAFIVAWLLSFLPTELLFRLNLISRTASDIIGITVFWIAIFPPYSFTDKRLGSRKLKLAKIRIRRSKSVEIGLFILLMLLGLAGIILLSLL